MKSCFFIGHRETSSEMFTTVYQAVVQHIEVYGVKEFVVGNYGGFDRLAARAVVAAKKQYPEITLMLLLPYHPAERIFDIPEGFDGSFYPPGMEMVPRRYAIVQANKYIINHADYLIAYVWHPASNARNLLEYAQKREERGLITVTVLPYELPEKT